ncbi:hypothetical protein [Pseudonocardia yunnanensis]|uniref:ATP-dependent DNA ligase n=1 Tax=Pseudonocardia yunnanensis TaxID=58107 RepID=UPI003CD06464
MPTAGPWAFEPKFDGFRAIATADRRRVRLHSRQNRPLTRYFPEIVSAIADQFAGHVVLDGELVVCRTAGLDFMALQRRLTATRHAATEMPATFVMFDVLAAGGTDLRTHPYRIRRALLLQLLDDAAPPLAVVPMTTDGQAARAWLTGHLDAGIEGVVAKRLDHGYLPARRAWRKVKTRTSAEAVVGGVLGPLTTPVALVLGRRDNAGRLRVAGRTGPLPRAARPAIGALLRTADEQHPWPSMLPPARFRDAAPVEYTRVNQQSSWNSPSTQHLTSCAVGPSGGTQPPSAESATTYKPTTCRSFGASCTSSSGQLRDPQTPRSESLAGPKPADHRALHPHSPDLSMKSALRIYGACCEVVDGRALRADPR